MIPYKVEPIELRIAEQDPLAALDSCDGRGLGAGTGPGAADAILL